MAPWVQQKVSKITHKIHSIGTIREWVKSDEDIKPKQETQNRVVTHVKGKINVKAIIGQLAAGGEDNRPFVQLVVLKELKRINKAIMKNNMMEPKDKLASKKCDIVYLYHLDEARKAALRAVNKFKPVDVKVAMHYYKTLKSPKNHDWIQQYLTHENLHSNKVLFKSEKLCITITDGYITYKDKKYDIKLPIQYNSATDTFYL